MTTLVTGGTGTVGRAIVQGLLERGLPVRVLSRTPPAAPLPGVEYVTGDLAGELSPSVLAGVRRLFLFPAPGDLQPTLKLAAAEGVEHLVVLSSLAAAGEKERDRESESGIHHRAVESAVADSGIPATILRPGMFATNLLFWASSIRFSGGVDGPYPTSAQAPLHERDLADVALAALTDPSPTPRIVPLTGPVALTQAEQLETIAAALGRPLTFRTISPEQFTATMTQWMPAGIVAMLLRYWAETVDEPDAVHPASAVTGRSRTLAEWARDHVADFA
ncbi:MAG: NAD(P)H-binding protein [Kineosporiaceae bacterium]